LTPAGAALVEPEGCETEALGVPPLEAGAELLALVPLLLPLLQAASATTATEASAAPRSAILTFTIVLLRLDPATVVAGSELREYWPN